MRRNAADGGRPRQRQDVARAAVLAAIPLVHAGQHRRALMHCEHRSFGQHIEVFVGYDRRDLDDDIGIGLQTRHFKIDPNQIFGGFHRVSVRSAHRGSVGMVAEPGN